MWQPQLEAFPGWRILALSLPGFDGVAPLSDATIGGYADHVLGQLDLHGIERAVVGGVSMGGYIGLAVWRRAPDRVAGLILADTRSGADTEEARAGRLRMLETLDRDGVEAIAAEMVPKVLGKTTHATRPDVVSAVRGMILTQGRDGVAGAVRAIMSRPDSTPLLESVTVPTIVIVGEEDTITPPAEAEKIHAGVAGSTLVRIPGAGHMPNIETPEAFNAAVATFLR
jgi:3-oxoadipate enol-lactonase